MRRKPWPAATLRHPGAAKSSRSETRMASVVHPISRFSLYPPSWSRSCHNNNNIHPRHHRRRMRRHGPTLGNTPLNNRHHHSSPALNTSCSDYYRQYFVEPQQTSRRSFTASRAKQRDWDGRPVSVETDETTETENPVVSNILVPNPPPEFSGVTTTPSQTYNSSESSQEASLPVFERPAVTPRATAKVKQDKTLPLGKVEAIAVVGSRQTSRISPCHPIHSRQIITRKNSSARDWDGRPMEKKPQSRCWRNKPFGTVVQHPSESSGAQGRMPDLHLGGAVSTRRWHCGGSDLRFGFLQQLQTEAARVVIIQQ